jgi:hypothetical protein
MRFLLLPLLLCAGGLSAPTTEAAASPNPFAGSYSGYMPVGGNLLCGITISADGQVFGTGGAPVVFWQVVTGTVSNSGQMSCTVTLIVPRRGGARGASSQTKTKFQASVTLDAAGNIVGTTKTGQNFVWYRQ